MHLFRNAILLSVLAAVLPMQANDKYEQVQNGVVLHTQAGQNVRVEILGDKLARVSAVPMVKDLLTARVLWCSRKASIPPSPQRTRATVWCSRPLQ